MEFEIEARRTQDIRNTRCRGCIGAKLFAYNRYCRKDRLCRLKRAPHGEKTTDGTEAILAINWLPLNRMHRI